MPRIQWDTIGDHIYESGLDRGVLYVSGQPGVPWNGLISVKEKSSGGTSTGYYIDGQKFLNVSSPEEFSATIEAFTYPDEFMVCDGVSAMDVGLFIKNQPRQPFSLSYRTLIGNDVSGTDFGYKIHLIYNALAAPSQRSDTTLTDSPSLLDFSWDITAQPSIISGFRPSAYVIIDTRIAHPGSVSDVENILYGNSSTEARMPTMAELVEIFEENATLRITDNGDGTWTAFTTVDGIITINSEMWVQTLIDNFNDNSFDTGIWQYGGGTETGGTYHLPATSSYPAMKTNGTFNLSVGIVAAKYSGSGTLSSDNIQLFIGFVDSDAVAVFVGYSILGHSWFTSHWGGVSVGDFIESSSVVLADGDWLGLGNIGDDNVCHVYHSTDGITWIEFHSFTVSGIDKGSASFITSAGDTASTATYALIIDNASYFENIPAGDKFTITWASAEFIDSNSYTITSL